MIHMVVIGEKYTHYKHPDRIYEIVGVAKCTDDINQRLVIYKALYEGVFPAGQMWARPMDEFVGDVNVDGVKMPRFRKIEASDLK